MSDLGLYIHVPFCDGKCPYCDFYSSRGTDADMDGYASAVEKSLASWGGKISGKTVDTVYFGGGTPSLLKEKRIGGILNALKAAFDVDRNAETTVECNPRSSDGDFFEKIAASGVNRLSVGVQSFDEGELELLGRRHSAADAENTIKTAFSAGIENISLDLMINLPHQTCESIARSIERAVSLPVRHVSVYMLKNEKGTAFEKIPPINEDEAARQYLFVCEELTEAGFMQYEISNFAVPGFESRHNLKYWHCEEYLGVGPAAHSFLGGKRFFYPRDTAAFIKGVDPTFDAYGGDDAERAMLGLRLTEGIAYPSPALCGREKKFIEAGLMQVQNGRLSFTRDGFLVSNAILSEIL